MSTIIDRLNKIAQRERSSLMIEIIETALEKIQADGTIGGSGIWELVLDNEIVQAPISISIFDQAVAKRLVKGLKKGRVIIQPASILHKGLGGYRVGREVLCCELLGKIVMVVFDNDKDSYTHISIQSTFNLKDEAEVEKVFMDEVEDLASLH